MGLGEFKSQVVFLDTSPLIYFMEGISIYQKKLSELFLLHDKGYFTLITSVLTLLEVLVQPLKLNRTDLVEQYKKILTDSSGLKVADVNVGIASEAAELRAKYGLKTPDSIQVATALVHNAKLFFTNDKRLRVIEELKVITLSDFGKF
ncbi:type II toxin-antitoxin system VapC family toxin [Rubrolithibacter danxiaensis]|uniref:type II toxin-antitoxin system VapC family toxin n=1 Tax=Rubrolithibacter danxiaensis TaxID=3390805 RepID=UPI003BF85F93